MAAPLTPQQTQQRVASSLAHLQYVSHASTIARPCPYQATSAYLAPPTTFQACYAFFMLFLISILILQALTLQPPSMPAGYYAHYGPYAQFQQWGMGTGGLAIGINLPRSLSGYALAPTPTPSLAPVPAVSPSPSVPRTAHPAMNQNATVKGPRKVKSAIPKKKRTPVKQRRRRGDEDEDWSEGRCTGSRRRKAVDEEEEEEAEFTNEEGSDVESAGEPDETKDNSDSNESRDTSTVKPIRRNLRQHAASTPISHLPQQPSSLPFAVASLAASTSSCPSSSSLAVATNTTEPATPPDDFSSSESEFSSRPQSPDMNSEPPLSSLPSSTGEPRKARLRKVADNKDDGLLVCPLDLPAYSFWYIHAMPCFLCPVVLVV